MVPFSIYSSAIKYNKSFIETLRLLCDNQSKFKKNESATNKSIQMRFLVFSNMEINYYSLYNMSLSIGNQLLVNL